MLAAHPGQLVSTQRRARLRVDDLSDELAAIAESTAGSPDDEHDAEGSTVGYERARVTALLAKAQQDLAHCERALRRLARGWRGACTMCGGEIPAERLAALPATGVCAPCARSAPVRDGTAITRRRTR